MRSKSESEDAENLRTVSNIFSNYQLPERIITALLSRA